MPGKENSPNVMQQNYYIILKHISIEKRTTFKGIISNPKNMIKPLSKILIILSIISSTITANFYTPINSTLDTRLLTKEGRQSVVNEVEQIKKDLLKLAAYALYYDKIQEAVEFQKNAINKLLKLKDTNPQKYNEVLGALNEYNLKLKEQNSLGVAPLVVIPPALVWFTSYLNAPDVNEEPKSGIVIDNPALLATSGGLMANMTTKGLSATILNQTAQTSIKAGLVGASIDAGLQIGSQIYDMTSNGINFSNQNILDIGNKMIDNANNIKFSNFKLDYSSVLFSGIAMSTTVLKLKQSLESIVYSLSSIKDLKSQLKTTSNLGRQTKIQDRIKAHEANIKKQVLFQTINGVSIHELKNILGSDNE